MLRLVGPRFAAPRAAFSFDAEYLALPLRRDEAALSATLHSRGELSRRPLKMGWTS